MATGPGPWLKDEWFLPDRRGRLATMISSKWTYSKPHDVILRLDEWAKGVRRLRRYPALNLIGSPESNRVRHRRIISWIFFCQTAWTREPQREIKFARPTVGEREEPTTGNGPPSMGRNHAVARWAPTRSCDQHVLGHRELRDYLRLVAEHGEPVQGAGGGRKRGHVDTIEEYSPRPGRPTSKRRNKLALTTTRSADHADALSWRHRDR